MNQQENSVETFVMNNIDSMGEGPSQMSGEEVSRTISLLNVLINSFCFVLPKHPCCFIS